VICDNIDVDDLWDVIIALGEDIKVAEQRYYE
jgi:hypothetical protein